MSIVACGGTTTDEVTGVIVSIDGDLTGIDGFDLATTDGTVSFETHPRFSFHDGPPSHLFDHLRSSEPITVRFERDGDRLVATSAGDG